MLAPGKSPKGNKKRGSQAGITSDLTLMGRARSPYPVFRILAKADRFTRRELQAALGAVSRADRQIKRGGPGGKLLVEQVIIGICRREQATSG
jgi:DNA polymerase III delta subunit